MAGINDEPHQVDRLLEMATAAGATSVGGLALHLRGDVRHIFMAWLRSERPDLVPRYEELYRRGAYAPTGERERLARMVRRAGIPSGFRPVRGSAGAASDVQPPRTGSHQESLF